MCRRHSVFGRLLLPLALGVWIWGCQDVQPTEPALTPQVAIGTAANHSENVVVRVSGGGQARVTDENGNVYLANVAIAGAHGPNGAAHGSVNFVFGADFAAVWGVEPGVHAIHVRGKVTSITAGDGTVTLAGTAAVETEIVPGRRPIVFTNEPFALTITGPGQFSFWWCEVPSFDFELITGSLTYSGYSAATLASWPPIAGAAAAEATRAVLTDCGRS
jgi:hypothetical protein